MSVFWSMFSLTPKKVIYVMGFFDLLFDHNSKVRFSLFYRSTLTGHIEYRIVYVTILLVGLKLVVIFIVGKKH